MINLKKDFAEVAFVLGLAGAFGGYWYLVDQCLAAGDVHSAGHTDHAIKATEGAGVVALGCMVARIAKKKKPQQTPGS